MARLGVTYQDIANAANQLLGEGKQPTIEQIRHILGTGSSTTIANHLRKWRAEQSESGSLSLKENLPQEFVALMKGLWERLVTHANEKITAAEEQAFNDIQAKEQELQKTNQDYAQCQQRELQLKQEKESLLQSNNALEQAFIAEQKTSATLQSKYDGVLKQLEEKQERITELSQLHAQVQANLEHYREAAREQRILDQEQFDQQKQELQMQIKILRENSVVISEKFAQLQQEHQTLQKNNLALAEDYQQIKTDYHELNKQYAQLEKQNIEQMQSIQHWQSMYQQNQQKFELKMQEWIDIKSESQIVKQQLETAQLALTDALEKNKFLGHEKWILAQEKSVLEGQLKQMQTMLQEA